MASVWVARLRGKRGFEKLVAIKTILPKYAQDARFERMFLDEAGLAARIEHANVAQVLDLGEEHDVLYLAMELVDGDALSKLLNVVHKKGLSIPAGIVLRILADTCGGLHAAHEVRGRDGGLLNVVHRDVSPQNILVTMHGVAKLIDFGIAKARDRVSEDTSEGQLKGKIHYMAPEQALGKQVDRRADIFAVGAIIYFLLAGRPPFAGENELSSLFLLSGGRPPPPLPATVHPAVSAVVMRALSHQPDQRFATAADMQAAIETAMAEADLVTTTTNVAAFVQEHMAERARRRKEGMDLALSAAAQREKVARMLERAGADTPSGHGMPGTDSGPISTVDATYATVLLGKPSSRLTPQALAQAAASPPDDEKLEPTKDIPGATGLRPRKLGWVVAGVLAVIAVPVAIAFVARPKSGVAVAAPPHPSVAASVAAPAPSATPRPDAATVATAPSPDAAVWEIPAASPDAALIPWGSATATTSKASGRPPSTPRPAVAPAAPVAPTSSPPATPASSAKHRVNDGF